MSHLYMVLISGVVGLAFGMAWALVPLILGALISLAAPEE